MSDEKSVRIVVPAEKFVMTWQKCNTTSEVAEQLGMDLGNVKARGIKLKKMGIPLKDMPMGQRGRRLDIDALSKICAETT